MMIITIFHCVTLSKDIVKIISRAVAFECAIIVSPKQTCFSSASTPENETFQLRMLTLLISRALVVVV